MYEFGLFVLGCAVGGTITTWFGSLLAMARLTEKANAK